MLLALGQDYKYNKKKIGGEISAWHSYLYGFLSFLYYIEIQFAFQFSIDVHSGIVECKLCYWGTDYFSTLNFQIALLDKFATCVFAVFGAID